MEVEAKGMKATIAIDEQIMNMTFNLYKYDADKKQGIRYANATIERDGEKVTDLSLNQFDNFIRERNAHNNNILRFNIEFPQELANPRLLTTLIKSKPTVIDEEFDAGVEENPEKTRLYDDTCGYKYTTDSSTYICNNISNVISFKIYPYGYYEGGTLVRFNTDAAYTIDESSDSSTYETATDVFTKISESYDFVKQSGSVYTKPYPQLEFTTAPFSSTVTTIIVYMEYNYKTELIDSFLEGTEFISGTGTEALDKGVNINFVPDIDGIKFEVSEANA